MRRIRRLELVFAGVVLLGPMVYALTLSAPAPRDCPERAGQTCSDETEPTTIEAPEIEVEPSVDKPAVEAEVVEVIEVAPEVAPAPTEPPEFPLREFAFIEGGRIVLSDAAEADWGQGALFEPSGEAEHRAAKLANLERIPSEQLAQLGRRFDLYGYWSEGKLCTVKIERLLVVAQYGYGLEGLFGEDEVYDPDTGMERSFAPERIRRTLWKTQPHWLVGEFTNAACKDPLWARDAALPAPVVLHESDEPSELSEARVARFRSSDQLKQGHEEYEQQLAELDEEQRQNYPSWTKLVADNPPDVETWLDPQGQARFIRLSFSGVSFDDDSGGCQDSIPHITTFDAVQGDEFIPTEHGPYPSMIIDVDLDGEFELLYVTTQAGYNGTLDAAKGEDRELSHNADIFCPC
jgi:hypothetical protein